MQSRSDLKLFTFTSKSKSGLSPSRPAIRSPELNEQFPRVWSESITRSCATLSSRMPLYCCIIAEFQLDDNEYNTSCEAKKWCKPPPRGKSQRISSKRDSIQFLLGFAALTFIRFYVSHMTEVYNFLPACVTAYFFFPHASDTFPGLHLFLLFRSPMNNRCPPAAVLFYALIGTLRADIFFFLI